MATLSSGRIYSRTRTVSTAVFERAQTEAARSWLASYGWSRKPGIEEAWAIIEKALSEPPGEGSSD
jgi:hypothetical protein